MSKKNDDSNINLTSQDIQSIWKDIESWYQANAPDFCIANGALEQDIHEFEAEVFFLLPDDYRASLKRHNGGIYFKSYEYNNLMQVQQIWVSMRNLIEEDTRFRDTEAIYSGDGEVIQNIWWSIKWIPFAADSDGNLYCIDTAPGKQGKFGQIIYWDRIEGPSPTQNNSFLEWLNNYRDDLYAGLYKIDENGELIEID